MAEREHIAYVNLELCAYIDALVSEAAAAHDVEHEIFAAFVEAPILSAYVACALVDVCISAALSASPVLQEAFHFGSVKTNATEKASATINYPVASCASAHFALPVRHLGYARVG